ncbi:hypothetical protein [Bradyrhizobium sp. SZCCHNR3118]|uniref:hypothetical protein n=1 Tax=Bradyrhizobium sp. SZCCHNR3118 TaxID=3057468 RepID=UPI002916228D|nr:hypothetical protein [Bradyrhizobium sp. SZCCHNR3118]
MAEEVKLYVTVTSGMRGFFAVLIDESAGFPEPVQTGMGSYQTAAGAAIEAKDWARAEGLEFRE